VGAAELAIAHLDTVHVPRVTLRSRTGAVVARGSNANSPAPCPEASGYGGAPAAEVLSYLDVKAGPKIVGDLTVEAFVYPSAKVQAAVSAAIRTTYHLCPKQVQEFYTLSGQYEFFSSVSRTAYTVGGWKGLLVVQNAKVAHHVVRAFDAYLGKGNVVVHLRWAGPASFASAARMKASYGIFAKAVVTRLGTA
jgi:hypothetical protein